MATLIKRENSPYWIAAFDVVQPDGTVRRLKKSTKKKKRSDAMIEAVRLEELERKGNVSDPDQTSKAYTILAEAAEAAAKGHLSEARAREMLGRISQASTGETLRFYTVKSWADDYLKGKAARGKPATLARYSSHIKMFLAWLGPKAGERLETITKTEMRTFRDQIRAGWIPDQPRKPRGKDFSKMENAKRTAKTTNHYAADVAAMFRAAVREGLILASPSAALERLHEDDSIEREVFTLAEVSVLVKTAGEPAWQDPLFIESRLDQDLRAARCRDWIGITLLGFYAGARLTDCARMTWENVDLERAAVSFMPEKTARKKKRLEIPLHPRLLAYLKEIEPGSSKTGPLFPTQYKVSVRGNHGLSGQFVAIIAQSGIDRKLLRESKGRQRAQYARSFHSLRHSLTSNLANLDVPEEIRRRIVGHESADVHAKYTHTERETLARALEKLPSV